MEYRGIETEHEDVLQNLEAAIVTIDKANTDLTDLEVLDALDNLIRAYTAEENGRPTPFMRLSPLKRQVYDAVKDMAEWRMGRTQEASSSRALVKSDSEKLRLKMPTPITLEELLACLKRIRLSIKRWNGSNGRRGYLEYVRNFLP